MKLYSCTGLSPLIIIKYAANQHPKGKGAKHVALAIVKGFLRYLYEQKETIKDLSLIVPKDNYKKQPRLPSTYTKEEICMILESIDRSNIVGKRNYTVLMLAVRLGMRASDISALEFKKSFMG